QEILRCESPGETSMPTGDLGGARAYFTPTESVVTAPPVTMVETMYCAHTVLLSGLAELRETSEGSSQGGTPPSGVSSVIVEAGTVAVSICWVGVSSTKVWSGLAGALELVHELLPLAVPSSRTRSAPVGVVPMSQRAINWSVLQLALPTLMSWWTPFRVSVIA